MTKNKNKFPFFLIIFLVDTLIIVYLLAIYFGASNPLCKNNGQMVAINSKGFLINSHRGFNASSTNSKDDEIEVNYENSPEFIQKALKSYDGVEFDLHLMKTQNGSSNAVFLHNDFLELFGSPKENFKNAIFEKVKDIDEIYVKEKLKKDFGSPKLKINFPQNKRLNRFNELFQDLEINNKILFPELKMGSTKPFGLHNPRLPLILADEIAKNKLYNNTVAISFYWWSPFISKIKMFCSGIYLPTGIDVVDEYAKPDKVLLAKLLLYDYFMPPHDQVTPELIKECKKYNIGLISWSRGSLQNEKTQLERLSKLYSSINADSKPQLGVIVNLNYKDTQKIFTQTK